MEIINSKELIEIEFTVKVKPENYKIIKQENIIARNDNLISGIYKTDSFGFTVWFAIDTIQSGSVELYLSFVETDAVTFTTPLGGS